MPTIATVCISAMKRTAMAALMIVSATVEKKKKKDDMLFCSRTSLCRLPLDVAYLALTFTTIADYASLSVVDSDHKHLISAYLCAFGSCELRHRKAVVKTTTNIRKHTSRVVSILQRVGSRQHHLVRRSGNADPKKSKANAKVKATGHASVAVLDLQNLDLDYDRFFNSVRTQVRCIVADSRNKLSVLVVPNMIVSALCPSLFGCTRLRVCHGLQLHSMGDVTKVKKWLNIRTTPTLESLTFTISADLSFEPIAKLIAANLHNLASLGVMGADNDRRMSTALLHLAKLPGLTSLTVQLSDDNLTRQECVDYGRALVTFPALKTLVFTDSQNDTCFSDVVWTLPPTVTHCINHCCGVSFDAKQMQRLHCDLHQDAAMSSLCSEPLPQLVDLRLWYCWYCHETSIDNKLMLDNMSVPSLVKFRTSGYFPSVLFPVVLRMPMLRFLYLYLDAVISHKKVAHFLSVVPLIEEVRIRSASSRIFKDNNPSDAGEKKETKEKSDALVMSDQTEEHTIENDNWPIVHVPLLRTLQFISHGTSLEQMLLSIEARQLNHLRVETICDTHLDTCAIVRHFPWLMRTDDDGGLRIFSFSKK